MKGEEGVAFVPWVQIVSKVGLGVLQPRQKLKCSRIYLLNFELDVN